MQDMQKDLIWKNNFQESIISKENPEKSLQKQ
jgi:hypothetical protein